MQVTPSALSYFLRVQMVRCLVAVVIAAVSAKPTTEGDALHLLQVGAHRPVHRHEVESQPRNLMSVNLCDCDPPCICEDGRAKVGVAYDTMDTSASAFNKTVKSGDLSEMKDFIRAVIIQSGGQILNDYGISVLAPYYTGQLDSGTLDELKADLTNPEWASYWSIPGQNNPQQAIAIEAEKVVMPAPEKKKVHKKSKTTAAPKAAEVPADKPQLAEQEEKPASEPAAQPVVEEKPSEPAAETAAPPAEQAVQAEVAAPKLSPDITLDQAGYEKIASMKDNALMAEFIRHVVWMEGGKLKDEKPLQWFSKYHSGEKSTQNFKLLDAQLRKSDWIEGMPAPENVAAADANPQQQQPPQPAPPQ